jgi:hypothetical protein
LKHFYPIQMLSHTDAMRPPATKDAILAKPSSTTVSSTASSASNANSQTTLFGGGLRPRRSSRNNGRVWFGFFLVSLSEKLAVGKSWLLRKAGG